MPIPLPKQRSGRHLFNTWIWGISIFVLVAAVIWALENKLEDLAIFGRGNIDLKALLCTTQVAFLFPPWCSKTKSHILVASFPQQSHVTPLKVG
jgi:hypothetical protein